MKSPVKRTAPVPWRAQVDEMLFERIQADSGFYIEVGPSNEWSESLETCFPAEFKIKNPEVFQVDYIYSEDGELQRSRIIFGIADQGLGYTAILWHQRDHCELLHSDPYCELKNYFHEVG